MIKMKVNSKRVKLKVKLTGAEVESQLFAVMYNLGATIAKLKEKDYALWEMTRRRCSIILAMAACGKNSDEIKKEMNAQPVIKADPSTFTKKDRQEIARRTMMGERIVLQSANEATANSSITEEIAEEIAEEISAEILDALEH